MFGRRKAPGKVSYDPAKDMPVIRSSICTGEKVAGFKARSGGGFRDVMLIRSEEDLDVFRKMYGIEGKIPEEY